MNASGLRIFPDDEAVINRNVGANGSAEANAWRSQTAANMSSQQPAGVAATPTAGSRVAGGLRDAAGKMLGTGDQWKEYIEGKGVKLGEAMKDTGRVVPPTGIGRVLSSGVSQAAKKLGPLGAAYEAYTGIRDGDLGQVGMAGLDYTAASSLASPAAPLAGTYLMGRGIYEGGKLVNDNLSDATKDTIGGTINAGLRKIGLGTNDDAYLQLNAGSRPSTGAAAGTNIARDVQARAATAATPIAPALSMQSVQPEGLADNTLQPTRSMPLRQVQQPWSITKKITNAGDGSAPEGSIRTWNNANPVGPSPLGPGRIPGDGTDSVGPGAFHGSNERGSQSSALRDGFGEGPIADGLRQQLAYTDQVRQRAEQVAGSSSAPGYARRLAAVMQSMTGTNNASVDQTSLATSKLTNEGARMRLLAEMARSDRDYGLRVAEHTRNVGNDGFTQNQAAEAAFEKNLESRFRIPDPKTGENVADRATIAQFRAATDKTIPELAKALESTGQPDALRKAADLRKRKIAALEPGDIDALHQLYATRERMAAARGLGPNQGTFAKSDNLLDYQQLPGDKGVDKRAIGGNRVVTKAGSVSANDLRYADGPANAFFPDFNKVESLDLTHGLRGLRKE